MGAVAKLAPGTGVECFDTTEALAINRARLDHLDSLCLALHGKRVLDVGCGVGHLADFLKGRAARSSAWMVESRISPACTGVIPTLKRM